MTITSNTHLVLIPSYNPGTKVYETVRAARQHWSPVWVVVDGRTDGTAEGLQALAAQDTELRVIVLPHNQGKGAAVLHGLEQASGAGYTHVLTMDSDGQHPPERIPASRGGASRTGGPISKHCGPASATHCSVSASIRLPPCSG